MVAFCAEVRKYFWLPFVYTDAHRLFVEVIEFMLFSMEQAMKLPFVY